MKMEGELPKYDPHRIVPLRLNRWLTRDARILIWRYLTKYDKEIVRCADNSNSCLADVCQVLYECASLGYLNLIKWIREKCEDKINWRNDWFSILAAQGGHLEVLKFFHEIGGDRSDLVCAAAAAGGHLEALKWLRNNKYEWDSWTCTQAAMNDHLEVLKWARFNGCRWNSWTINAAAEKGYLEILKWLYENGCPLNGELIDAAMVSKDEKTIEWCKQIQ